MSEKEKENSGNLMKNIKKPKIDTLDYGFKILSNGLKVFLISDPKALKSSAALGVNIGSLVDKKDEQGLAHFCEHLLFMGNEKYPSENDYQEYLAKNGGFSNAGTQLDRTIYYFDVSNEAFEGALDRFAHFFICSKFNEGSIEREKKAIDNEFTNINTERCKETLKLEQKDILRRAHNIFLNGNYQVNFEYVRGLLNDQYKNPKDIINFFKNKKITIDDLIKYKNAIFKNSKSKWLIQGNLTKEQALEIVEEGNKILEIDMNEEKIGKFFISRPVVIKKNYNYIFRIKSPNPEEKCSSLISIYQAGLLNDLEFQYLKITESFLKEKFFDKMRTKETLGYIASLLMVESSGYYGLANIIQSNSKTPEYCASRVRNFYKQSYEDVKNITEEEFKSHVNGQLIIVNKKEDNLSEVFLNNWKEINDDTYKFDRKKKAKENLEKCNREEFIKFYEKYFIKEIAIVDSEFLCEAHYEQNEKDIKQAKILEGENIIKRIVCDTFEDFRACNCLGVIYNNPAFMENNK